jgi:hypothetical protein
MRASFRAYGLGVHSTFELPVSEACSRERPPSLALQLSSATDVGRCWSGPSGPPEWQTMFPGDCHVRFERGHDGDHLLTFGRRARFHLDQGGGQLLCAPSESARLEWQRFLLETALCCASSIRGFEALHASAVGTPAGTVAFVAARGAGKSTLAAELVARGHTLVCDDVLALSRDEGEILAHPGPPLMTLAAETAAACGLGEALDAPAEDGTQWVRVPRPEAGAASLAAIFILERHRSLEPRPVAESCRPGRLAPHTLSLSRDPARALSRLGLLRELAASVPHYSIGAPAGAGEVGRLADAVEAAWAAAGTERPERGRVDHASAA